MNIKMKCLFVVIIALFFFAIGVYVGKGDLAFKKDTMHKGAGSNNEYNFEELRLE